MIGLAQPQIGVSLVDMDDGVGKGCELTFEQAADVVGVHVGDKDVVDLVGTIAGGFQALLQLSDGRP